MTESSARKQEQTFDTLDHEAILTKISTTKALPSKTLLQYLITRNEPLKSAEIQQVLNMSPQSVTNIGSRLEELGLVSRARGSYSVETGQIINLLFDAIITLRQRLDELEANK